MSKKEKVLGPGNKVVSAADFEAALKSEPQVFDSVALGVALNKSGGYDVIKVSLDSKGLEAGDIEIIDTAENKWEANEKFKINAVKLGILKN